MSDKEHRAFNCPVLGGIAQIQLENIYLKADELPQPKLLRTNFTDCANKYDCGIGRQVSQGSWIFDWDRCPAYTNFNKRG